MNSSIDSNSSLFNDIADVQPSVHEDKKSCCERFCYLLYTNQDLTKSEYKKYINIRKDCLAVYDERNEMHEKLLKDLFDTYLDLTNSKNEEKITTSWKILGFQVISLVFNIKSENPRTDFRAGGYYSLKFMHYFAWRYSKELTEMIELNYFLFACVSIRLTYLVKLLLNLVKDEELESGLKCHKIYSCSRR